MTLTEIETLIEDTRKLPRAADKVALSTALGVLELARQVTLLNLTLLPTAAGGRSPRSAGKPKGKKKK